ncbi:MAG: hypothetical protein R3C99_06895 [Pirellulaceae bacterium]
MKLGLERHLSPQRRNGLYGTVERIRAADSGSGNLSRRSPKLRFATPLTSGSERTIHNDD